VDAHVPSQWIPPRVHGIAVHGGQPHLRAREPMQRDIPVHAMPPHRDKVIG
jgi:hypothetical protein